MRKILPQLLLFLLSLTACPSLSVAQGPAGGGAAGFNTVKTFTPSSPEMANFQRYGDVPVNYNTGVPDIKVPLGELSLTGFSWPISLSYHAGGHKVDGIASSAGLGWALQASGSVSSKVMGSGSGTINRFLELGASATFITQQCSEMPAYYLSQTDQAEATGAIGNLDQPDIYYLSLPTVNERFLLNGGRGYSVPISDNRIEYLHVNGQASFKVTDKQGNRYTFDLIGHTYPGPGCSSGGGGRPNPSYALTRVDTYLGEHLIFNYAPITYSYQTIGAETEYKFAGEYLQPASCALPGQGRCLTTTTTTEFKLTGITSSRGQSVALEYGSRADFPALQRLTGVSFREQVGGTPVERYRYDLTHSYFGTVQLDNRRLRLDRVTKTSAGVQPEVHAFEYDPTQLPHRLSTSMDYYGYANGTLGAWTTTSSLLPSKTNREPSLQYTRAAVLTLIKYPLKGATRFTYELNAGDWGGLRVKSVQDEDAGGAVVRRRTYAYAVPVNPGTPNFIQYSQTKFLEMPNDDQTHLASHALVKSCNYQMEQSSPVVSSTYEFMAESLSYGEVDEFLDDYADGTVGRHGKTVYRYGTLMDFRGRESLLPFTPLLTEKLVYKRTGAGYALVQAHESYYETTPDNFNFNNPMSPDFYLQEPSNGREARFRFKELELLSEEMGIAGAHWTNVCYAREIAQKDMAYDVAALYLARTVERSFLDDGSELVSRTDYGYDTANCDLAAVSVTRTGSDGVVEAQEIRHSNSNLAGLGYSTQELDEINALAARNVLVPVWQRHLRGGQPVFENQVFYSRDWGIPLAKREVVRPTGTGPQREVKINRYVNNLAVEVEQQDQPLESYRFNSKGEVTAVCKNASHADFAFASFYVNDPYGTGFEGLVSASALETMDAYASGVSYRLSAGPLTKGGTVSGRVYVVAGFQKGGAVQVSGATVLSSTLSEDLGNGWRYFERTVQATATSISISGTGLVDELRFMPSGAMMTTYAYVGRLNQVQAVTDANGQTTFYAYDAFGRLKEVSDTGKNVQKAFEYHIREN